MRRTVIDIHVLQTVPPSNINRDDTGSPKTAVYGGVRRARVSSQAWKRATRLQFDTVLDRADLGVRTKRVVELVGEQIAASSSIAREEAEGLAREIVNAAGIKTKATRKGDAPEEAGYLVFLSRRQVDALASAAIRAAASEEDVKEALKKVNAKALANQEHSVDVSLFGRMVAEVPELNVDAAAQVAHAISVHAVDNEYDYFTAVDDHKHADEEEDAGAGMIGTVEFNSSTLYRYATVDVDRLLDNLGNTKATLAAISAFLQAFITSMPTGKQNTFANRTLPDAVLVTVRQTQPINLVGAFEAPAGTQSSSGRVRLAADQLARHALDIQAAYGQTPDACWVVAIGAIIEPLSALGPVVPLDQLVREVGELVSQRLAESA